tara:strand:- start:225 stop:1238 length:1014 start_codon:yes stop_codon:yes gene_type:complete
MEKNDPQSSIHELQMRLSQPLAELNEFLDKQIEAFEPQIRFLVQYCLKNSGKRIRPSLVFLTGNTEDSETYKNLVQVSAVIEMVHLATLVHDDILDRAQKRRGQPTISSKYGQHTAVLLGDALFSHALHLASQFETVEVCRLVSKSTRRVCSGEILQTFRRGDWKIEQSDYLEMLDMKTGELFSVATYLAGILSNYSHSSCQVLKTFGSQLGIAYQAYDDLTDFIGDEAEIGKTLGTDLSTGKATLPLIQLFQLKNKEATEAMTTALESSDEAKVRYLLDSHSIFEVGFNFVSELWSDAVETLAKLPDTLSAKSNLETISQILRVKLDDLHRSRLNT